MAYFTTQTLQFLADLKRNNQRDWFQENKPDYVEHVRDPFLRFIADIDQELHTISKHYFGDARANGGSLFRIYRDIRFSKDKTPYKTWAGARFKHRDSGTQTAPVFYLHIQPGNNFIACGVWNPGGPALNQIRDFLHHNPNAWRQLKQEKPFQSIYQFAGESLKRMPRGYDADHPLATDLKRKSFAVSTQLTDQQILADDINNMFLDNCKKAAPFIDYLCAALDLDF